MTAVLRKFLRRVWMPLVVTSVVGCVGKTSVEATHPLIAADAAGENAKVYFLRPDPGFRGVMDMPVTISLGGTKLLKLAKGQYTLLPLASGTFEITVNSYTVAGQSNAMTPVSTTTELTFPPRTTHYLLFELVPRQLEPFGGGNPGSEVRPREVSRESALEVAQALTPVGMAIDEPISQR